MNVKYFKVLPALLLYAASFYMGAVAHAKVDTPAILGRIRRVGLRCYESLRSAGIPPAGTHFETAAKEVPGTKGG